MGTSTIYEVIGILNNEVYNLHKRIKELEKENSEQKIRIAVLTNMLTYSEPYAVQVNPNVRYVVECKTI